MRLLLDTQVLLWFLREPNKLSASALQAIVSSTHAAVSIVSLWEIAIKVSLNKLQIPKAYHDRPQRCQRCHPIRARIRAWVLCYA